MLYKLEKNNREKSSISQDQGEKSIRENQMLIGKFFVCRKVRKNGSVGVDCRLVTQRIDLKNSIF